MIPNILLITVNCIINCHLPDLDDSKLTKVVTSLLRLLYATQGTSLEDMRCSMYKKQLCGKRQPKLQNLPPTTSAALQHAKRTYLQVQNWLGRELEPLRNGFELLEDGTLAPNYGVTSVAPEALLKIISCRCRKDCGSKACSCQKAGMPCSDCCGCGEGCSNRNVEDGEQEDRNDTIAEDDEENVDDETYDSDEYE